MVEVTGWEIFYIDPQTEQETKLQAEFCEITDDLNGEALATFLLPNTSFNRNLVQQDLLTTVWFNNYLQFSGVLSAADLSGKKIKAYLYDAAILSLDEAEPISAVFDQKPADEVMIKVLEDLNIELGECPTSAITTVVYKANRLDIVKFIAESLGLEYYPSDGDTINIGSRGGNYWKPEKLAVSTRGIDRSKQADKVIIRGIDQWGHHITGEAGSGDKVRTFNEGTPANQDVLENIAAKKLTELQGGSSGAPVSIPIHLGYEYQTGDYLEVYASKYLLMGSYRIVQLTKSKTKVKLQLDNARKSIDKAVADLRNWEARGIYLPGSTSWSVNLQGLVGLYHLNEGEGENAKDSSHRDEPSDGYIVNGNWQDGPVYKLLTLAGDGYVALDSSIDFAGGDFSVGGWISPIELDGTTRYLAHKDGQFSLAYINSILRFSFTDESETIHNYDSDNGVVKSGGRLFVIATFSHANSELKIYINGQLHKTFSQNGYVHASSNDVYIGMFLKGALAEFMFWKRCIVDQEVLELYFFPLFRVVSNGYAGNTEPPYILAPNGSGMMAIVNEGTTTPPALTENSVFGVTSFMIGNFKHQLNTNSISEATNTSSTPQNNQNITETQTTTANVPTTISSYSETNQNGEAAIIAIYPNGSGISLVAQSFQVSVSKKLVQARFYLKKIGNPTGYLKAALFAHAGIYGTSSIPTGQPLTASVNLISMASLGTSFSLVTFTFPGNYTLELQNFCIAIIADSASTLNSSNSIRVGRRNASSGHSGNQSYWNYSSYTAEAYDLCFYVIGV